MKSKAAGLTLPELVLAEGPSFPRMPVQRRGMAVRLQPDVDHLEIMVPEATYGYDVEIGHLCSLCESWCCH